MYSICKIEWELIKNSHAFGLAINFERSIKFKRDIFMQLITTVEFLRRLVLYDFGDMKWQSEQSTSKLFLVVKFLSYIDLESVKTASKNK